VIKPGWCTTVQDLGRHGCQQYGVSVSGAMDRLALVIANRLVNNHDSAAGLDKHGPGAVGVGWDGMVLGLAQHFAGGSLVPAEAMAWMMSDEGREFMTLSSLRWQEANIEAGTDPAVAAAAAARTTAAYTAVPS